MSTDQLYIVILLGATIMLFLWGRWRHDLVALTALLCSVFIGLVPVSEAFSSFSHPAVITVASVLILGYGLLRSGAVDMLTKHLLPSSTNPTLNITILIALAAVLSGFMNNVGALALLMPMGIQLASKSGLAPGQVLMPLAFGSILGGMTTLIGTPTNLVVSGFRKSIESTGFAMFDFTPVGASVALIGLVFIGTIGWRIVPVRKQSSSGSFDTGTYFCEVRILPGSTADKMKLLDVANILDGADAQIIGLIRNDVRLSARNRRRILIGNDILILELEPESLPKALISLGLKLEEGIEKTNDMEQSAEDKNSDKQTLVESEEVIEKVEPENNKPEEIVVQEVVVVPSTSLVDRTVIDIDLPARYDVNLLAISRQGRRSVKRLRHTKLNEGDVLLLQGDIDSISRFSSDFGCLPLAPRDIKVPRKGHALKASLIMLTCLVMVAFGFFPAEIAFVTGALAFALFKIVPLRSIYTSIDWSVVVLLAALFPVANAMFTTGAADVIADFLIRNVANNQPVIALAVLLIITMFLSDLMNNVATAAVMCPIAISTASVLGVNSDAFLMAIAIGASCAFLTPIGHQNNTLILGPGGFHFGDYWKLGLILEVIVVMISIPMLLWAWPL